MLQSCREIFSATCVAAPHLFRLIPGHPLGATGAKLMSTLLNELERRGGRYGLLSICEGGGTANATIIERCDGGRARL